jgi:predicted regulator of amino acid metabolism with ACT domain
MSQKLIFEAFRKGNLNEDRPAIARDHFENIAKVVFDKSYSLYNELFNKIRAIDGVTIVSVHKSAKDFGPDRKTVMLSIKYIPAKNNIRAYETFVANEVRRVDGIHSCNFIGRAKRTQTDYQKKAGINLDAMPNLKGEDDA